MTDCVIPREMNSASVPEFKRFLENTSGSSHEGGTGRRPKRRGSPIQKKYFRANCKILGSRADVSVPKLLFSNVVSRLPLPLLSVIDGLMYVTLLVRLNPSARNSSL